MTAQRILARIVPGAAYVHLGMLYQSPLDVIAESVENELDAGADNIWYVQEKDRVSIYGNGHGMVAEMTAEDRRILNEYLDDLEAGRSPESSDPRDKISEAGRRSLEWMVRSIAFSSKISQSGEHIRGVKGLGALGYQQVADQAIWQTKPSRQLAGLIDPPLYTLRSPTAEQRGRNEIIYESEAEKNKILCDPFLKPLEHGTVVHLVGLNSHAVASLLKPRVVIDYLTRRFSADITDGRVEIRLVDRVTREGRAQTGGMVFNVQPLRFVGYSLIEATLSLSDNSEMPFKVALYYCPDSKGDCFIRLRRRGSEVGQLSELDEFAHDPWNRRDIAGFVEFPDIPDSIAPWTSNKRTPASSAVRTDWVAAVLRLEDDIIARISELQRGLKERRNEDFADDLARATLDALRDVSAFSDLSVLGTKKKKNPKTPGIATKPDKVRVACLNQYNQGVEGVSLAFISATGKLERKLVTRHSGHIAVELPIGRYTVKVLKTPDGIIPLDKTERAFRITEEKPGHREVFHFITDALPMETKRLRGLHIWMHHLTDPYQAYDLVDMPNGILQINTGHEDYQEAIARGDQAKREVLCAHYVAAALAEYSLQGPMPWVLQQQCLLFSRVLDYLHERRELRKKSKK